MNITGTFYQWLQRRDQRQRLVFLITALLVMFFLWFILWEGQYRANDFLRKQKIETLKKQVESINVQIHAVKQNSDPSSLISQQEQLKAKLNSLNAQIQIYSTQLISADEMVKALQSILREDSALKLISLKNDGNFLVIPTNLNDKTNKLKQGVSSVPLYQHNFTLEFEGNYFATLEYLKKLEALPWRFYGDSIDYQVTKYPSAKVTLKFHAISRDQGLLDVA